MTHSVNTPMGEADRAARVVTIALAVAVVGLAYIVVGGMAIGQNGKSLEVAAAGVALVVFPWLARWLLGALEQRDDQTVWRVAALTLAAAALIVGLPPLLAIVTRLGGKSLAFWQTGTTWIVAVVLGAHALGCILAIQRSTPGGMSAKSGMLIGLAGANVPALARTFQVALFLAIAIGIEIDPANRYLNAALQLPFQPIFAPTLDWGYRIAALLAGFAVVAAAFALAQYERTRPRLHRWGVPFGILAICLWYFDRGVAADPMHYLTNVSPAMAVLRGGVPLVDVFSQYGPGPVMVTALGFLLGPSTMETATLVVQAHNLALFAVLLFLMTRLTDGRLAVLLLGFAALAQLYGIWGGGHSNINGVPSVLGFRYLWPACMVLAISYLPRHRLHSVATVLVTAVAAAWSIEALVGVLIIHAGVVTAEALRDHDLAEWGANIARVLAPAAASIALLTLLLRLWAGQWPSFGTYLAFLGVYNPFSNYWGITASGAFWGWAPFLLTLMVVALFALDRPRVAALYLAGSDQRVLRGYLPLALLTAYCALYYLGRSVDFTILLALLPLVAIIAPVWLAGTRGWADASGTRRSAVSLLALAMAWASAYGFLSTYRPGAPYRFAGAECLMGRCLASSLPPIVAATSAEGLARVGYVGPVGADVVMEASRVIPMVAPGPRVAVFLGTFGGRSLATDLGLLAAGKAHRWPISYTFTDELVPRLAARIIAAPVTMAEGEAIIVRRDTVLLTPLERAILDRIRREFRLCELDVGARLLTVYRITNRPVCGSSPRQ